MSVDTITTEAESKIAEMIERIGKLLAKANASAAAGDNAEADAFTEKAFKLMARYDIKAAQITNTTGEIKDELVVWDYEITGEFSIDQTTLFFDVVRGVGARALRYRKLVRGTRQSYTYTMRVWGFESQTKRIKFLFEALLPQMLVGSAAAAAIVTWESKRSYRKSWMEGFGSAVVVRLVRTRKEAIQEANDEEAGSGTSAELVLVDKRVKVEDFFEQANTRVAGNGKKVKTYTTGTSRKLSGTGRTAGYQAGQKASFGDNMLGGGRLALAQG